LSTMITFTAPKLLSRLELSISVPGFTFSAWVSVAPQFVQGYLVRKRIVPAGPGTELACWGWHLSESEGPSLHYGAHDFFAAKGLGIPDLRRQEEVTLSNPTSLKEEDWALLTMVVDFNGGAWTVSFYHDLELRGTAPLKRPVTDCFNNQEGACECAGRCEARQGCCAAAARAQPTPVGGWAVGRALRRRGWREQACWWATRG